MHRMHASHRMQDMLKEYEQCLQRRIEMRRYLSVELSTLASFIKMSPNVLGPKFTLVLAIMRITRDEIMWQVTM